MNRSGFTVMELIIVMLMTVILVGSIVTVFISTSHAWSAGNDRAQVRENMSQAMELMVRDLRQATSIDVLSVSSVTYTANTGSGSTQYRFALYRPASGTTYQLLRSLGADAAGTGAVLLGGIPSANAFTRTGNVITIDLTAYSGAQGIEMRTKAFLREF